MEVNTQAWYNDIVCPPLQYDALQEWQFCAISELRAGRDVFAIAPTGAGKSTVVQGAVLVDQAVGQNTMAIILTPTKSLSRDQVAGYQNIKQLKAMVLDADSVTEAKCKRPRQDLFAEILAGKYTHVFIGPEMLVNPEFGALIHEPEFYQRLRYFVVDEAHITIEWLEFRRAFAHVTRLRNRLRRRVPWLGLSATVEPKREFAILANSLGFRLAPGATKVIKRPVDRPTIAYCPRFFEHACSEYSTEFLDVSCAIPLGIERLEDIPGTVIFASHVKHVTAIAEYLTRLLHETLSQLERSKAILPMDSVLSTNHNTFAVERLGKGDVTRILVCTDRGALGINVSSVRKVIILVDKETTYRMICQKIGRIRTAGEAIVLFPRWMDYRRSSEFDKKQRSEVEQVVLNFANATVDHCPRVVNAEYWGDEGVPAPAANRPCCNKHNPEIDSEDLKAVRMRNLKSKEEKPRRTAALRSDRTHRPLDETLMQPIIVKQILHWRYANFKNSLEHDTYHPPSAILPDHLIDHLAQKLHVCTSFERFGSVMSDWKHLEEFGASLYRLICAIWEVLESDKVASKILKVQEERREQKKKRAAEKEAISCHVAEATQTPEPQTKRQKTTKVVKAGRPNKANG